jgi:hypothetical protein
MTAEELSRQLTAEKIVPLSADEWATLAGEFEEVERHSTMIAGDLIIVRGAAGLAAVEAPAPERRVVRLFSNAEDVRGFVMERMEQYERMWDGCGCKIDYYA